MENLSHSFSKKSYGGNGFGTASHKSVYDDVFGGPPKFGMPTLAPRLEDYSEIFGGFHSARGSSIPILDLPVVDEAELCFDVRSSRFDYSEVFGGFDALDFTLSFEDLVRKSNGGDGPSDDAWSPAQSESLSDESDPSACSERSQSLSSADTPNALSGIRQVDISYHRANQRSNENTANVATDVAQLHAIPGHAYMIGENHASQRIEEPTLQASSYLKSNMDSVGIIVKEKQFKKSISLPRKCDLASCESDFYHLEKFSGSGFSQNEPFVTVNEINLRTRPSRLPPPSRPPPVFAVKEGVSEKLNLKLKASRSYAFEQTEGDSSLPFYDVEIDGTSSMMASTTMRDAMEKVEENIRSAKESMEQKEVSRSKLQPQNDIDIEEKMNKTFVSINRDDRVRGKCAKEGSGMKAIAEEQNNETKMNQKVSDVVEGESYINLADKTKRRHGRESRLSYQVPNKSEGTFAWRQGTEYFEVVEADVPFKAVEQHKGENMVVQMDSDEFRCWVATEAFELREDVKDFKAAKEAPKLDVKMNKVEVAAETCGHRMRSETTMASSCQTEFQKKAEVGVHSSESEMSKNKMKMAKYHEEMKKLQNVSDKSVQNQTKADVHVAEAQAKNNQWGISERTDTGKMLMDAHGRKANERRPRENLEMDKCHTRVDNAVEQKGNEKREIKQDEKKKQEEYHETQKAKKSQTEVCERKDSQYTPRAVIEHEDNEKRLKRTIAPEENEKNFKKSFEEDENERGQEQDCQIEIDKGRLREACMLVDNEENFEITFSQNHDERQSDACKRGKVEVRLKEDSNQGSDKSRLAATFVEDVEESSRVTRASEKSIHVSEEAGKHEELSGHAKGAEQIMKDGNDRTITLDQTTHLPIERENIKNFGGTGKPTDEVYATILPGNLVSNLGKPKTSQADISRGEDAQFRTEGKDGEWGLDMRAANLPVEESSDSLGGNQSELQHEKHENGTVDITNFPCLHERAIDSNEAGIGIGNSSVLDKEVFQRAYDPETMRAETHEQGLRVKKIDGVQVSVNKEISNDKYKTCQPCMEWGENGKVIGAALSAVLEDTENTLNTGKKCNQTLERKEYILNESLDHEDNRIEERLQKERELENELLRKIEEEREREREREKDRMAVNRATLEARDRSYAEARERAERAAVDRATAEVRQRAMAEAREKLEKTSLEARERSLADKASVEARLRVERAAVERATLEARQRAFEKAMTDKVSFEARERVERSVSDKFSSSRSVETRESSSVYDVPNLQSQSVGTSSTLRYSYSSVHTGVEGESPQRCKARLERYRRTAERAAKALAEKNMRDILAQREQSERNRLAETLDAEVKRWSSGKEGNLRALLSTLQYILGPDSGWQPIPLTEVITSASVKKAYRKATLCVHPDKLQQRGASIQQKYICEKVFDLLKEAWNIFNSEEW